MNVISKALKTIFSPIRRMAAVYGWVNNYYPYSNQLEQIEQIRHYRNWTYVGIRAIRQKIAAQVPVVAFKTQEVKNKSLSQVMKCKSLMHSHSHEELEPVDASHPLARLLHKPNEFDTSSDLWNETVLFHKLTGNAYWWIPRDDDGVPYEIWCIPSHWMRPIFGENGFIFEYECRPYEAVTSMFTIPADEIIHFKEPSPFSKVMGMSALSTCSTWVDTEESNALSRYFTLKNAVQPGPVLELDENTDPPEDSEMERIGVKFLNRYQGETKAGTPVFLKGMKMTSPPGMPPEMQYLQSEDQLRDMILAALGVPKVAVGLMDEINRAAFIAGLTMFASNTLNPLGAYYSSVLTEKLCPLYDESDITDLVAYFEDFTPNDPDLIITRTESMARTFSITPNGIRAMHGEQPLTPEQFPWADKVLIPMNLGPAELTAMSDNDIIPMDRYTPDESKNVDTGEVKAGTPEVNAASVTAMTEVLVNVKGGVITTEQGREMLILFYGVSEEQARKLIPDNVKVTPVEPDSETIPSVHANGVPS